jgi:hypothetical protein
MLGLKRFWKSDDQVKKSERLIPRDARPASILLRKYSGVQGPQDAERRVVEPIATYRAREIDGGSHIKHFHVFLESLVSMDATHRHINHAAIFSA